MKILCIVDNFPPEVNALASRTFEHAVEWVKAGHEVTVVTCCPNFPIGKPFKGYKNKLIQREEMKGIKVIRVWSYMAPNTGFLLRVVDFISFAIMAFIVALRIDCHVILTSSPQFFVNFTGLFLKIFKNRTWYMEVRDLWPESIAALNFMKRGVLYNLLQAFELTFYSFSNKIIVVTSSFKKKLIARGVESTKIKIVYNGINRSLYKPREKDKSLLTSLNLSTDVKIVGYLGTIGEAQDLMSLVPLFQALPYKFLIIGDGAQRESIEKDINSKRITNIILLPLIPKEETPRYYSIFDVALIPLRDNLTFKEVIPSKIFETASMNIPILFIGDGEAAEIVESFRLGTGIVKPSIPSMGKAIDSLVNNNRSFLKDSFLESFDRKRFAREFFTDGEE
jgi:glycosyltransferase involved in cell wall biosynthesis